MNIQILFARKGLNLDGLGLVEILIYINRKSRPIRSTGVSVEPKFWDVAKHCVKRTHPNADLLNNQILAARNKIENMILEHKLNGSGKFNVDALATKEDSFFDFFQRITEVNTDFSPGTKLIYRRTLKYLKEYSEDLPIRKVDVKYMEGFNRFLIETKKLSSNTRASLFKKIKKCFNLAIQQDLIQFSQNPFKKGFGVREVDIETKSLSLEELRKIESYDIELRPELERTRDMFLFACYTGLRYGDLVSLTSENFRCLADGRLRLSYRPGKTKHLSSKKIEWIVSDFWNGKIDLIINKYLDKFSQDSVAFFYYTNQAYNRNLKELGRFVGIEQPLTSHLARKTCITLLVNDFGLNITNAQLIAGHSTINMTMRYLRTTELELSRAAKAIDWS